ncbi:MAG: hypothetical protein LIO80_09305 [Lachnospiraceae bacterium]|nr:hypothetical protein [Lachnospiraceae bacterium]
MMIQKIWIWLLIPIVLAVSGCGENTAENYPVQDESSIAASDLWDDAYPETDDSDSQTGGAKDTADSADVGNAMDIADGADAGGVRDTADSAGAEDTTEISENISTEEDFPMKYKTGGQFYEDSFLNSMTSALGEDGENLFSYEDLPSGIFFSSYAEWESFWNSYPDTVDKEYEALYDETYFEEHQLIWFYLEVWNNLCSVDVEEIHYDTESGCIVMDVSWGEDPERGSIDLCSTYIVANFIEIQGKYSLSGDTPIEIQVTENHEY